MSATALLIASTVLGQISGQPNLRPKPPIQSVTEHERGLYERLVYPLLRNPEWKEGFAYPAGHFLMVPLHAAYWLHQPDWQAAFRDQFTRMLAAPPEDFTTNPLARSQYFYLASEFLVLELETNGRSQLTRRLETFLTREISNRWTRQDAIAFDHKPFTGVKARLDHKLSLSRSAVSYYRAITDEEMFLFAIASDLAHAARIQGTLSSLNKNVDEMGDYLQAVIADRGSDTSGGGWSFDTGVWADHPDDAYAQHLAAYSGMKPLKRPQVAWDSSHFHRFGLFVVSYRDAFAIGSAPYKRFESIRLQLATQFKSQVLLPPSDGFPNFRTKNYMDGWNGLYRYGSDPQLGAHKGYGGYQLSGTFFLGWWAFLNDPGILGAYQRASRLFPLSETVLRTYLGPLYTVNRSKKTWYETGMAELLTSLSSKFSRD